MNNKLMAKVLHIAADEYLADEKLSAEELYAIGNDKSIFSCDAIDSALISLNKYMTSDSFNLFQTLRDMGLSTYSLSEFSEFQNDPKQPTEQSQGARYLWLKWAALMLEENALD